MPKGYPSRRYRLDYFVFTVPLFIIFGVFFLVPLGQSFYLALTDFNGVSQNATFIGLNNFVRIFTRDFSYWDSYVRTILFTLVYTVVANLSAIALAAALSRGIPLERTSRVLFFLPNVLGLIIVGSVWFFILGKFSRFLGEATGLSFFMTSWLGDPGWALLTCAMVNSWQAAGWFMLVYIAGFQSVPGEVMEAAAMDGSSGLHRFWFVTLPFLMPSVTISLFLSLTTGLKTFDLVYALTGGGPGNATETVLLNIYTSSFDSMRFGYGVAKSLILTLIISGIGLLQIWLTKRQEVQA